jgi:hypothetical protein
VSRLRHAVHAHPVVAGGTAGVVAVGVAVGVALAGGGGPPVAGSWSLVSAAVNPTAITCHDATHCWADLGNGVVVIGPGTTRAVVELPAADGTIAAISCPSDDDCVAVGQSAQGGASILRSTDGGFSWSVLAPPASTPHLTGVSCVGGTNDCWAVGGTAVIATSDGVTWAAETLPTGTPAVGQISCPTTRFCLANGGGPNIATTDGGATWSARAGLPTELVWNDAIDCVTDEVCFAAGSRQNSLESQTGFVYRTTDGGASWSALDFPTALPDYGANAISCWSATSCLVDGTINNGGIEGSSGTPLFISTNDGGASWSERAAPESLVSVPAIDCVDASTCWLAGASGIGVSTDLGVSWTPRLPAKGFAISTVSCVPAGTAGSCLFAGTAPYPVSCHLAIGSNCGKTGPFVLSGTTPGAVVASDAGSLWSYAASDQAITAVLSISCTSPADCTLLGTESGAAVLARFTGSGLQVTKLPAATAADVQAASVLSCPAAGGCVATGAAGGHPLLLRQDAAGGWSQQSLPSQLSSVTGLSCPIGGECLVVGTSASASAPLAMWEGASGAWSTAGAFPSSVHSLTAAGCASAAVCWVGATLTTGAEMLRTTDVGGGPHGASWSAEPLPAAVATVTAISCSSTADCAAVGTLAGGGSAVLGAGPVPSTIAFTTLPAPPSTTTTTTSTTTTTVPPTTTIAAAVTSCLVGGWSETSGRQVLTVDGRRITATGLVGRTLTFTAGGTETVDLAGASSLTGTLDGKRYVDASSGVIVYQVATHGNTLVFSHGDFSRYRETVTYGGKRLPTPSPSISPPVTFTCSSSTMTQQGSGYQGTFSRRHS